MAVPNAIGGCGVREKDIYEGRQRSVGQSVVVVQNYAVNVEDVKVEKMNVRLYKKCVSLKVW